MYFSRRDLLKLGAGAAVLSATEFRLASLFAEESKNKKKIPIGVQLYSVRDVAAKDPAGTIAALANMGYQGVEFAGYYDMKAEDLRKILDQNGLKCCGTHIALDALTGEALKNTVDFNKTLGNEYLIVSSLPPTITTSLTAAKTFTDAAAKAKESGMRVGYHAHAHDFKPVGNQIPWEVFFTNAGPDVLMQLDTGNCMAGGADPVAVLKKFPHRSATIHLKEYGEPKGVEVGEGDVPWKEVFAICETTGDTQWYILEQETYRTSSLESVAIGLKNLREMGK